MVNLIRGGLILVMTGLFVAFIYASQATPEQVLAKKDGSNLVDKDIASVNFDKKIVVNNLETGNSNKDPKVKTAVKTEEKQDTVKDEDQTVTDGSKKLVKSTALVSARGISKGAFSATAYCLKGRTALGHGVRRGIVAADPRVLKLGSKIIVSSGGYTGEYLVSDTGGGVKGRELDIWVPSCSEAIKFGRRSVQVFVVPK